MQSSARADTPRWRRLTRIIAGNPRAAVYGTIAASAVIAAAAVGHLPAEHILVSTLAALLVFWLAHVYAGLLDHGVRHAMADLQVLAAILVQELSMLVAPALSLLFLALGALDALDDGVAVGLALGNGVAQLVGWGIDVGRQSGQAWPAALLTGLVNGALGVVIILLEVQLH